MNDDQYFLANAYLDGELTDDDRRIAEGDPDVMSEVDRLRSMQSLMRSTDRPSEAARNAAIAAAMAEFRAPQVAGRDALGAVGSVAISARRQRPASSRYLAVAAAVAFVGAAGLVVAGALGGWSGSDDSSDESSLAVSTETLARNAPEAAGSATTLAAQMEMDTAAASDLALTEAPAAGTVEEAAEVIAPAATVAAAEAAAGDSENTTLSASMPTPYATTGGPIEPIADREVTITTPGELAGLGTLLASLREAGTLGATPETSCLFDDAAIEVVDSTRYQFPEATRSVLVALVADDIEGHTLAIDPDTCEILVVGP